MEVVIAVGGTFHAFELAEQLNYRDSLATIFTSYPRFKLRDSGVPNEKIQTFPHTEVPFQLCKHRWLRRVLPDATARHLREYGVRKKNEWFDAAVSRNLHPVDEGIFLGFASKSLKSLKRASELGYTTVLENSSAHVKHQTELLAEEYDRYDVAFEAENIRERVERITAEYDRADYIMTPSTFARQSFIERGFSKEKVKSVSIGIDPPERSDERDKLRDDGTVRFIYSGAVICRKGPQYVLEAWDSLDLPDAELVLTSGIGPSGEALRERYEDRDDVEFVGWVDDLYEWFEKSSVFVFPSVEDGFGMVVTEAMASGLPVIVSENTGAKDCVREGKDGFVVPIRDPDTLAEAMKYLYDHPDERRRMGKAAQEQIRNEYTIDDYGDRIYECYRRILSSEK